MGAIHNKIKKLREQSELTQQDMADKMSLHLKTWQKIENGITKLDIDRLQLIANILETSVEDLINIEDSVYINEIKNNEVGFNNSSVTIQKTGIEKELYDKLVDSKDKMIEYKDKIIEEKDTEIEYLKNLIDQLRS